MIAFVLLSVRRSTICEENGQRKDILHDLALLIELGSKTGVCFAKILQSWGCSSATVHSCVKNMNDIQFPLISIMKVIVCMHVDDAAGAYR